MSEQTNNLLHLFSKLLRNPKFLRGLHMEMMSARLRDRGNRNGAQGLLVELWKQDGLTNAEIAELLDIKPSSVTAQVKNLEEAELVTRIADENDKRVSRVFLTEKGREAKEKRSETRDNVSSEIFDNLTEDEQATLATLLDKLVKSNADSGFDFEQFCEFPFANRGGFDPRMIHEMGRQMHGMGREMKEEMRRQFRENRNFGAHNPWNWGHHPAPKPPKAHDEAPDNWNDF